MWDVDPLQVRGVMLWYAKEVQVISLLLITDLCGGAKRKVNQICMYKRKNLTGVSELSARGM